MNILWLEIEHLGPTFLHQVHHPHHRQNRNLGELLHLRYSTPKLMAHQRNHLNASFFLQGVIGCRI